MKKFLLAAAAALTPALLWAQFSLTGTVRNKEDKQALPGATVMLDEKGTQALTDGTFRFSDLPAGTYKLKVTYVGFLTWSKTIKLSGATSIDVLLDVLVNDHREVDVTATRAVTGSANTYRNVGKAELEKNNLGQDLPYLLNQTPSVVVTSDAGAGVGYTGIRIRGSDPTRVNVTLNGIPYNDTESQGTYFVDVPDLASSVYDIQVQRGVGTSTNGAGAFGGSLNIRTNPGSAKPYASLQNTFGSYDTWKNTINLGSGTLGEHFSLDGRLSRITSDGYIDRASSDLKSYFFGATFFSRNDKLAANTFSGKERTYQAWNGVPEAELATNRRYNGFTYPDQTDNYRQDHYQLIWTHRYTNTLQSNTALHYTRGRGYYEEYKEGAWLGAYGLPPVTVGSTVIDESDLVRRRWLDNDFYGATWALTYDPTYKTRINFGGAWNEYDGKHFGEVISGQYVAPSNFGKHYYEGSGVKTDFNVFGKLIREFGALSLSADLQFRHTGYCLGGTDKNRNPLNQDAYLNFFNPKFGIEYGLYRGNVYASFAVAHKEPNRDDYINSTLATRPAPERLNDIEIGYNYFGQRFSVQANLYGMFYKDQLILTGKINDVGEYIRQNVARSYRLGVEVDATLKLSKNLDWKPTASLSRNRVNNFVSYDDDYDNGGQIVTRFDDTGLAFSPSFVGSSELSWKPLKNFESALLSKYVSRQFLDNTSNSNRQLGAFFVNDLRFRYDLPGKKVKNIGLTLLVNNVFNELYESNGYTFSYLYGGDYTTENYYYPQAERNFLVGLGVKF